MANTDFSVLLKAELDRAGIDTDLKKVQEIVKKYHLELTPDLQTASLKNQFKSVCKEMANDFNKAFNANVSGNDVFKVYENKAKQLQQTLQQVNKIQLLSNGGIKNDYATQIAKLEGDFRSLGLAQDTITTKTQNVKNSLATLRAEFAKPVDQQNFQTIQTANDNLQRELIESINEFERLRASMKGMATEQQRLSLANTIEAWNQKNTAATKDVLDANQRYILSLRDLNTEMTKMDFNRINTGFKQNENSMRALHKLGKSLKEQFTQAYQSFTMWLSASTLVMKVVSETKEAITELKEVNTLLTEISKANDQLTKEQLNQIADDGFDTASKYGKNVTDYLSGVQEASRAGYDNAEGIAELSVALQGAGDMTADLANSYIIATDKAYSLNGSVSALTTVLDGANKITNENAVNMTELAEGMSVVGSQAASSQMSVEETTAAIGTLVAVTQQGGSEMGNAFKGILMNLRQVTGEVEDGGDAIDETSLTKYEKACNELGVSLSTVKDGVVSLKEPMQILKELSVEYQKLDESDAKRANLLSAVGGKYRANALNALLENYDLYEEMLQDYADGTGSMAREAEKTANSWEGSLNRLHNTWVDTVENVANSDAIITVVNGFNYLLSIVNEVTSALGSLGTIGVIGGGILGAKNAG